MQASKQRCGVLNPDLGLGFAGPDRPKHGEVLLGYYWLYRIVGPVVPPGQPASQARPARPGQPGQARIVGPASQPASQARPGQARPGTAAKIHP